MDTVAAPPGRPSLATHDTPDADGPDAPADDVRSRWAWADDADAAEASDTRAAAFIVALLAFTIPLATGYSVWATATGADDWNRRISLAPFDLILVLALGWTLLRPALLRDLFRSRAVQVVTAAFIVCFAVSLAVHASPLGFALAARLAAGLAVIAVTSAAMDDRSSRRLALGALAVSGVLQATLGMVQSARGQAFGIELLDFGGPLYPFGASFAGRGGLTHPYHLAVFLVITQGAALLGLRQADRRRGAVLPWLAALVVIGAGIAVTYTRSGALGQVALIVCLLLARADRRRCLAAVAAIAIGLGVGAVAFGDGWVAKGDITAGRDGSTADSNRSARLHEATDLIASSPITGVGPGRYVDALAQTKRAEYLPAHDLLAHEAAELGVAGGAVALALLALLGLRVLRGGVWTGAVVIPMVPFLLLDAYPYVFATGLAISAVWLGLARASLTDPSTADAS